MFFGHNSVEIIDNFFDHKYRNSFLFPLNFLVPIVELQHSLVFRSNLFKELGKSGLGINHRIWIISKPCSVLIHPGARTGKMIKNGMQ